MVSERSQGGDMNCPYRRVDAGRVDVLPNYSAVGADGLDEAARRVVREALDSSASQTTLLAVTSSLQPRPWYWSDPPQPSPATCTACVDPAKHEAYVVMCLT